MLDSFNLGYPKLSYPIVIYSYKLRNAFER